MQQPLRQKPSITPFGGTQPSSQSLGTGVPVLNLTGIQIPPPSTVRQHPMSERGSTPPQNKHTVAHNQAFVVSVEPSETTTHRHLNPQFPKLDSNRRENKSLRLSQEDNGFGSKYAHGQTAQYLQRKSLKRITEKSIPAASDRSLRDTQENFSDKRMHPAHGEDSVRQKKFLHSREDLSASGGPGKHSRVTQSLDRKVLPELSKSQAPQSKLGDPRNVLASGETDMMSPMKQLSRGTPGSGSDYFRGKRPVVLERETFSEASKQQQQPSILTRLRKEKEFSMTGRVHSRFFVSNSLHPEEVRPTPPDGKLGSSKLVRKTHQKEESAWAANSQTVQGMVEELTSSFRKSAIGL